MLPPRHNLVASTEDQMRKSTILVATAALAVTNVPALAGKYGCVFRTDNSPIKQCNIESGVRGSPHSCDASFTDEVMGTCSVRKLKTNDELKCFFHTPDKGTGAEKNDAKFTTEPGFLAGGLTDGAPANLTAAYRESGKAPFLSVLCEPFRSR
jgi:hypothetical protein